MTFAHTWVWSDIHFGHERVAELRGFDCVDDHDEYVLDEINALHSGRLILAGDLTIGRARDENRLFDALEKINRDNHLVFDLILGNHDLAFSGNSKAHKRIGRYYQAFRSVQSVMTLKYANRRMLVSHFPYQSADNPEDYSQWKLPDKGKWLLHGHTHDSSPMSVGKQIHIGVDAWHKPPTMDEILDLMDYKERFGLHETVEIRETWDWESELDEVARDVYE